MYIYIDAGKTTLLRTFEIRKSHGFTNSGQGKKRHPKSLLHVQKKWIESTFIFDYPNEETMEGECIQSIRYCVSFHSSLFCSQTM